MDSRSSHNNVYNNKNNKLGFRGELFIQAYFLLQTLVLIIYDLRISDLSAELFNPSFAFFQASLYCFILSLLYLTETIVLNRRLELTKSKTELKDKEKYFSVLAFMAWALTIALKTNLWHLVAGLCLIAISYAFYNKAWGKVFNLSFTILLMLLIQKLWQKDNSLPESFSGIAEYKYDIQLISSYVLSVFLIVLVIFCIYAGYKYLAYKQGKLQISHERSKNLLMLTTIGLSTLAVAIILFTQVYLWSRLKSYSVSTYDMGIFTQMYHSIIRNGKPLTTIERDFQTSHFNIHVSPTVYLLAPVFKLLPYPETLQLAQIFVVYIALIPFLLLAKEYGLRSYKLVLAGAIFSLQPAFLLSNYYDFHENIFLAPCIMFLIYFIYKGNYIGILISGLLLLGVKEDAVIYFVAIAIYLFIGSKDKKVTKLDYKKARLLAGLMVIVGVIVFTANILYLRNFGTGDMSGRFSNLMPDEKYGLLGILLTLIFNPSFYLLTIFVPRKFIFLFLTFMFMGFLPLFNRRFSGLALLLPLLIINLSSNYAYQFELFFQYNYGSHLFLLVLALLVVTDNILAKEKKPDGFSSKKLSVKKVIATIIKSRRIMISLGLVIAVSASAIINLYCLNSRRSTITAAFNPSPRIEEYNKVLPQIPRNEIIWADPFFTTYLADTEFLYDLDHHKHKEDDELPKYIVMPRTRIHSLEDEMQAIIGKHYKLDEISGEYISVYKLVE